MKAITTTLYICGGLMAAAAVMGAIDYKVARQKGIFNNLYKEEKPAVTFTNNKQVDLEDYSRGRINDGQVKEPPLKAKKLKAKSGQVETIAYVPPLVSEPDGAVQQGEPNVKQFKKFSFRNFSRAALPRAVADDEEVVEAASDTAAITEN